MVISLPVVAVTIIVLLGFQPQHLLDARVIDGALDRSPRRLSTLTAVWNIDDIALYEKGDEILVNTYTNSTQRNVQVAAFDDSRFVAVWESYGQDDSEYGVFGQIFSPDGSKNGTEFQVNTYTTGDQLGCDVCVLNNQNFVVVWSSYQQWGTKYDAFAQMFDPYGAPIDSEFQVSASDAVSASDLRVSSLLNGGFVSVWYNGANVIVGQLFDSRGFKTGNQIAISGYIHVVGQPEVCGAANGNFVVTWREVVLDENGYDVMARIFNPTGVSLGNEFVVNNFTRYYQHQPDIACTLDGGFFIVWSSSGIDGSDYGIVGQLFDESGNSTGADIAVNTYTKYNQYYPSVTVINNDSMVVSWASSGQDGDDYGVYAQLFDTQANQVGFEFQVNSYTSSIQHVPNVVGLPGSEFVVAWTSNEQDGSSYGLYMQLFDVVQEEETEDETEAEEEEDTEDETDADEEEEEEETPKSGVSDTHETGSDWLWVMIVLLCVVLFCVFIAMAWFCFGWSARIQMFMAGRKASYASIAVSKIPGADARDVREDDVNEGEKTDDDDDHHRHVNEDEQEGRARTRDDVNEDETIDDDDHVNADEQDGLARTGKTEQDGRARQTDVI